MDLSQLGGLLSGAGSLGAAYLPYEAGQGIIDYLKQQGTTLQGQATQIGQEAAGKTEFTPFSVKTGTGTTQIGAGGGITQQLGETPAAIQQGLLAQALGQIGTATPTTEQLFAQMQATRQPGQERAQLELENRLFAQGRGGTQTAAYGGTPEALALQKAIQEQQSADLLSAMTTAPTLAGQNIQNIQGLLQAGYTPESQALSALTPSVNLANIAQSARQGASEALYKGGIAGLEAQAAAGTGVAGLEAQRVRSLADALSGLFAGGTKFNTETGQFESTPSELERILGLFS